MNQSHREALFKAVHSAIHEAADSVGPSFDQASLAYPPGATLTQQEEAALQALDLCPAARSGLRKLALDACSYPVSHLFSLLDGVADPEMELEDTWLGATLTDKQEGDATMLHDELFESYQNPE